MATASLTLIGKPGCHLCDDARTVVTRVIDDLSARGDAPQLTLAEVSILDDPAHDPKALGLPHWPDCTVGPRPNRGFHSALHVVRSPSRTAAGAYALPWSSWTHSFSRGRCSW